MANQVEQTLSSTWSLSEDELSRYRRDGYIIPRYRLTSEELAELRSAVDQVIADNPALAGQPLPMVHVRHASPKEIRCDGSLIKYARHDKLLDLVAQVAGPDLILWQTTIFHKAAQSGPPTPWHQDSIYWPIDPPATTSVWIAVTDARVENACVRVIPLAKTGGQGKVSHLERSPLDGPFLKQVDPKAFREEDAVDIELEAGQFVLFDCHIIHGASANTGSKPRTGFAVRYMPSTSHFMHHDKDSQMTAGALPEHLVGTYSLQPLFLVRGQNHNPANDLKLNHDRYSD